MNAGAEKVKDERLRVPIDDPYLHSLGLAVVCFARLEWNAAWCCEKMQSDYLRSVGRKTAGQIANDLVNLTASCGDANVVAVLDPAAIEFKRLVGRRNDLVHANPGTAPNGDQRLFRVGSQWTIEMVDDLSDEFAAASSSLNHTLHKHFK